MRSFLGFLFGFLLFAGLAFAGSYAVNPQVVGTTGATGPTGAPGATGAATAPFFDAGAIEVGGATIYTNQCDCSLGGCSVAASGTTCTCSCAGCTSASYCYSQPYWTDAGTTAAAEFGFNQLACSTGTVTLTITDTHALASSAKFNVHCNN